jgi:hypothetical protein
VQGEKTTKSGKTLQAPAWLSKTLTEPIQYKLVLWKPDTSSKSKDEGVVYNFPLTPQGAAIMVGNGFHAMINTMGCWMLFRNYNWPKDKFKEFNHVYNDIWRPENSGKPGAELTRGFRAVLFTMKPPVSDAEIEKRIPDLPSSWRSRLSGGKPLSDDELDQASQETYDKKYQDALTKLGYDVVNPPAGQSTSDHKFIGYDHNFAWAWFLRHIVGLKCFSQGWTYSRIPSNQAMNFFKVDGNATVPSIPLDQADPAKLGTIDPELFPDAPFVHHDGHARKFNDSGFTPDGSLFTKNALGFQTATSFVVGLGDGVPSEAGAKISDCFWSDLYFYKEDNAPWPPIDPDHFSLNT